MLPDEELHYLKALQNGDLRAVEKLVDEYYPALLNFLLRLGCPSGDAEDIIQDTFIKAYGGISRYQHREKFRAWLFKICHNNYRDYYKKASRSRELPYDPYSLGISAATDPEGVLMELDQARQIQRILQLLPTQQRMVIILRYYHEFTMKEIAHIIRCPIGTVKSKLNAAHKNLRKIIEEEMKGE